MIAQGTVVLAAAGRKPGHEDRYRGPADAYGQHSVFQARQRGGTHLSITPACARRLEGVLVQRASAVGEETAEARDDDRAYADATGSVPPPPGRSPGMRSNSQRRKEQGAPPGQIARPSGCFPAPHYLGESGHVGQADSGGKLQQHGQGDEQGQSGSAAAHVRN
jgi:hypothetical protein